MQKKMIAAYLDMLGTTDMIQSAGSAEACRNLHALYQRAYALGTGLTLGEIKIKIFSDNLILAQALDGKNDKAIISSFIQVIAALQFDSLSTYDWLLRGGITIGDLFMDDIMVWGEALVRSYQLEDHVAVFPRVVIDPTPDIYAALSRAGIHGNSWLQYDADGLYFLHYLYSRWNYRDLAQSMCRSFDHILERTRKSGGTISPGILQKLSWHKRYVNRFLRTLENPSALLRLPSI